MKEYARLFYSLLLVWLLQWQMWWSMLTNSAQALCLNFYHSLPLAAYHQALVCGSALPDDPFQSQLLQIGLIHMLVVSGAHLGFLQRILQSLKIPAAVNWFFLSAYTLLTGAQAPVLRALAQRFNQMPSRLLAVLWAGIFALGVFGPSYSLLLSWIATLAICWPGVKAEWKQAILVYILMIPPLLALGTQHPLSILWNLIAAALLGWGLLPISMLAPLHPWLATLSHWAWDLFLALTRWMTWMTPDWNVQFKVAKVWPWIYLACLQFLALRKEQKYLRSQLFEK